MTIQVRVLAAQARKEIALIQSQLMKATMASVAASRGMSAVGSGTGMISGLGRMSASLTKWGSQLQWAGRQLQYNFTIPLAIAGVAATKFAIDNERAFVKIAKVYGDNSDAMNLAAETELPALQKAFVALSNEFAVNQAEVLGVAADWAAAGASGVALAKATKLTLETMILGEMDSAEATQALIAIQAQYGFSIDELSKSIDTLNMVENQTGITMQGLVQGMSKSAGVARTAGIDVTHLAAMLAALVPAAGSANLAGNALKTMISRLLAPTGAANDILAEMGINVADVGWQSLNGSQRLEKMAQSFNLLSDGQKALVSSTVAGRFQINRFEVLMNDITNANGYYQRSLNTSSDATANFKQRVKELNLVLESNPQKLKQVWIILQNALSQVITPLIPSIVYLATVVANLMNNFANADPVTQKLVLALLAAVAAFGMIARYVGVTSVLFGLIGKGVKELAILFVGFGKSLLIPFKLVGQLGSMVATAFGAVVGWISRALAAIPTLFAASMTSVRALVVGVGRFFIGPWGIAIAAVLALFGIFRDQIAGIWNQISEGFGTGKIAAAFAPLVKFFQSVVRAISEAFWALPKSVQSAMMSVYNGIRAIVQGISNVLSYINPFKGSSQAAAAPKKAAGGLIKGAGTKKSDSIHAFISTGEYVVQADAVDKYGVPMLNAINAKKFANGGVVTTANTNAKVYSQMVSSAGIGKDTFSSQRSDVSSMFPQGLALFDTLLKNLTELNTLLDQQDTAVAGQQAVVDQWDAALKRANKDLDAAEAVLTKNKDALSALTDEYDAHAAAIAKYAAAPITGMGAMSDAIFANDQAQKQLQLDMMKLEDVTGPIDDITNRMASLQGDIESLRGSATDLRSAGAGSDVLGPINGQIAAMEAQYGALSSSIGNTPMDAMQKQLDALQRQGQELDLQNSLQFDPLTRQIDQLANGVKELDFSTIVDGIRSEQTAMATLQPQIDSATQAVNSQQAAVDQLTAARDAVNATYDTENTNLQDLQAQYSATKDAISSVTDALNSVTSAASAASAAQAGGGAGGGGSAFSDAAAANFPDVGGAAQIGREGDLTSQADQIDAFTADIAAQTADILGSFDMWGPLRAKWDAFKGWWNSNVVPAWNGMLAGFAAIGSVFTGLDFSGFVDKFNGIVAPITSVWNSIASLFGPQLKAIWDNIASAVGPALDGISKQFGPLVDAVKVLWDTLRMYFIDYLLPVLQVILKFLSGEFVLIISQVFRMLGNAIGPVIQWIGSIVGNVIQVLTGLINVASGIIQFVVGIFRTIVGTVYGLFTGDWTGALAGLQSVWSGIVTFTQGVTQILGALWSAIWNTVAGALAVVWGIVAGFVQGFVDFFTWLYDTIIGNSIIPDLVNGIINWIVNLVTNVTTFVSNLVTTVVNFFINLGTSVISAVDSMVSNVINWFVNLATNVGTFVSNLVTSVIQFFVNLGTSVVSNVSTMVGNVITWVAGLPGKALNAVVSLPGILISSGKGMIQGLWDGAKEIWNSVTSWVGSIPQMVITAIGNVGTLLKSIGNSIIQSFLDGLKETWTKVTDFVGGIASWIAANKGPKSVDEVLLTPAGRQIMGGLGQGLMDGIPNLQKNLNYVTSTIRKSMNNLPGIALDSGASASNGTTIRSDHASGRVININGDLSFPNIKSSDDAETFIRNLETLAGGGGR